MNNLLIRYTIICLTLCLFGSGCKQYTCEDFKSGDFVYADTAFKDMTIRRVMTGTQEFDIQDKGVWKKVTKEVGEQVETFKRDGRTIHTTHAVIWDGPCSYSLVYKSTDSPRDVFETKYDTFRVSVTDIDGDRFNFIARLGKDNLNGQMIKVGDVPTEEQSDTGK